MAAPNTAYVQQYQNNIQMLSQQFDSRFRPAVMVDTNFTGKRKYYDQYNTDSMTEIMSRYADTPTQLPNHERRSVAPRYFVSNTLEDPVDALQMVLDPKSAYMQAKVAAANRQLDDLVIAAFFGTALTGEEAGTSTTFPAAQQIASGSAGMTKGKTLDAKRVLDAAEVVKEDRFAAASAQQFDDLLNTTEVASSDFNTVRALVEGEISTWIGFKWIHSERLNTNGSSERRCPFWQKKGMQLAIQKDIMGRLDERKDKNYAWQVYMRMSMGATRLEEASVVEVPCAE